MLADVLPNEAVPAVFTDIAKADDCPSMEDWVLWGPMEENICSSPFPFELELLLGSELLESFVCPVDIWTPVTFNL